MKQCTKCLAYKCTTEFNKGRAKCKECFKMYNAEYRRANRELLIHKANTKYWEDPEKHREMERLRLEKDVRSKLISSAKHRALRDGKEFNITKEDIKLVTHCPILGTKLTVGRKGKPTADSFTLDRKDNDKGYIKGNVFIVSYRANVLKSSASIQEVESILTYMKETENV